MNLDHNLMRILLVGTLSFGTLAGCAGPDEPNWQYDQADMEVKFFGTWAGTLTPTDEEAAPFRVTIRSHDDVARAPACGSRDFSDEATPGLEARCMESTSLAVSATIMGDGTDPEEADGYVSVMSETLTNGDLWLDYRSSASRRLLAYWQRDEPWNHCELRDGSGSGETIVALCTLERGDVTE